MRQRNMDIKPKVIFGIDGSLTDYNRFVERYAFPYFIKRYGMPVVNPEALEIEDIFDIKGLFENKGLDPEAVKMEEKRIML